MKEKIEKKETKTKAKKDKEKTLKPVVNIHVSAEIEKRTIALSKTTWEILDDYKAFLSAFYGGKVTAEQIIQARIESLAKDRAWAEWRKKEQQTPAPRDEQVPA